MMRFLNRVLADIRQLRNLESYAVAIISIALIILGIFNDIDPQIQLTIIIAALSILVLRGTAPEVGIAKLDDVLRNRKQYGQFREFIKGGRTLWIAAPSAINILRDPTPIIEEILSKNGSFTVLLQDPESEDVIATLHKQLDIAAKGLRTDIQNAAEILERLKARGKVEYGYLPYSPGFSITIVDPDKASGRLVVEFFGYTNEFIGERMHIQITRAESEFWFEYWVGQYREMLKSIDAADRPVG